MQKWKSLLPGILVASVLACEPHGVQTVSKLSNAGDSISQGFAANADLGDHPELSWVQGTDPSVDSIFQRYASKYSGVVQEPESVSGAELVGGDNNFVTQAARICAQTQKPNLVFVLLGANDVCNRDASDSDDAAANLYSVDTFTAAAQSGFDLLAGCLPDQSTVQVMSMPRVDSLYDAGHDKGVLCYDAVWPVGNICRVVTAEDDAGRRQQIGERINAYNEALAAQVAIYDANSNKKNPHGIEFRTDWQGSFEEGHANTSLGAVKLTSDEIDDADCFHPTQATQAKIACAAWGAAPHGAGEASVPGCFN